MLIVEKKFAFFRRFLSSPELRVSLILLAFLLLACYELSKTMYNSLLAFESFSRKIGVLQSKKSKNVNNKRVK
jgi:hypothetical protein